MATDIVAVMIRFLIVMVRVSFALIGKGKLCSDQRVRHCSGAYGRRRKQALTPDSGGI
jgi:hypothetical protein